MIGVRTVCNTIFLGKQIKNYFFISRATHAISEQIYTTSNQIGVLSTEQIQRQDKSRISSMHSRSSEMKRNKKNQRSRQINNNQDFFSVDGTLLGWVSMTSLTLLLSLLSMKGFHEEYSASEASSSLNNKQTSLLEVGIEIFQPFDNSSLMPYLVYLKLVLLKYLLQLIN